MRMPKSCPCAIAAAILSLGIAHAAPPSAPPASAPPALAAPATRSPTTAPPANASSEQRAFGSAQDAVTAFVAALRERHEGDLRAILGPQADRVIDSGDHYADKELHARFLALYDEKHALEQTAPGHMELDVGPNDWPMPIPIVESGGQWLFDTAAGVQEIVDRRIGRNELAAIRTLLACEDAQHDYFERTRAATGTGVYAMRVVSTPGHEDGLYWPVADGDTESPLGPLIDAAHEAGYPAEPVSGKPIPYEGYYFRILHAQGPNGDGGAKSYLHSGQMTEGFAMIAWPARFKSTGIMTFIMGPDGDVYQKDLGAETAHIAETMTTFDPDLSWAHIALTNE